MIGSQLTRYDETAKFIIWDLETTSLNLMAALPWELSWAVATFKGGIESIQSRYIWWDNLGISEEAAIKTRFDKDRYKAAAKPPLEVWNEFSSLLYSKTHRSIGHNLLGYDTYIISVWRRAMGLAADHSWLYDPPLLDTNCLAKCYRKQWTPDVSSAEAFVAFQYRCSNTRMEKGVKTNLGAMCKEFKIEYNEWEAHAAQYDVERNWLVAKELIWKVEC